MNEVIFEGRLFSAEDEHNPNFVEDVDMSGAVLRLVEFRGFNLEAVRLPDDPGLRVIKNYPCVLKAAVAALQDREDETARVLRAILTKPKRELGHPLGLFNRDDFVVHGGQEMAALADEVIRQAEQDCKSRAGGHLTRPGTQGAAAAAPGAGQSRYLVATRTLTHAGPPITATLSHRAAWPGT